MPAGGPYALSDFERRLKIGEGTYGVVYQCKNRITGEMKALKKIRLENDEEGVPATSIREMALLKELKHKNIVALEQVILENGKLYLVFEYVNEDLKKFLDSYRRKRLDSSIVQNFMYQMMQGLLYCHMRRILHRDLKPQNILVDKVNMVVKLADFGLARAYGLPIRPLTHEVVTLWYRAPEVLLGCQRYNCSLDVWSMGCIFIELAISEAIFRGDSEIDQLFAIFKILGTPDEETWPTLRSLQNYQGPTFPKWPDRLETHEKISVAFSQTAMDLLRKMLTYNPNTRINARDVLLHKYFEDLDKTKVPAIGEEYIGLPSDELPREIAEAFNNPDVSNIQNLDPKTWLQGSSCFRTKEKDPTSNDMSIDY